eukprot:1343851-Ditylum_brightwellii.AAC.1
MEPTILLVAVKTILSRFGMHRNKSFWGPYKDILALYGHLLRLDTMELHVLQVVMMTILSRSGMHKNKSFWGPYKDIWV